MNKKKLILVIGPTATGKTKLSISLAQKYQLPIVNADSLLFYNELNIGVAKPSKHEMELAPHYLINISSIKNPINAKIYLDLALPVLEDLWQKHPAIILSGGSGFYLRSLLYGMYESATSDQEVIDRSQQLYNEQGIDPFIEILKVHDHDTFLKLHMNDHYRLRRAVEHWWTTGTPLSLVSKKQEARNETLPFWKEQGWELLPLYLDMDKAQHDLIIRDRTRQMLELGLIDEVKNLLLTFSGLEKPMQSIGYKETQAFLKGEIQTLEELFEKIVISTRQLAKSQRTWFAKVEKNILDYSEQLQQAKNLTKDFLI